MCAQDELKEAKGEKDSKDIEQQAQRMIAQVGARRRHCRLPARPCGHAAVAECLPRAFNACVRACVRRRSRRRQRRSSRRSSRWRCTKRCHRAARRQRLPNEYSSVREYCNLRTVRQPFTRYCRSAADWPELEYSEYPRYFGTAECAADAHSARTVGLELQPSGPSASTAWAELEYSQCIPAR